MIILRPYDVTDALIARHGILPMVAPEAKNKTVRLIPHAGLFGYGYQQGAGLMYVASRHSNAAIAMACMCHTYWLLLSPPSMLCTYWSAALASSPLPQ
jgi:hypothetical protein